MTEDFIQENEDRELFRRIKQGSEEAFRVVYGKYHRILYAVALKMLKDRSAAENAVQHVFVKLWIGRQEMTVMLSLRNYLYTMTRNYILNYLRSRNTELVHSYRLAQLVPEASDPLDAQIEREDLLQKLDTVIAGLPTQKRQVMYLRKAGYSNPEIAEMLNLSVNTVRSHYQEGVKLLRSRHRISSAWTAEPAATAVCPARSQGRAGGRPTPAPRRRGPLGSRGGSPPIRARHGPVATSAATSTGRSPAATMSGRRSPRSASSRGSKPPSRAAGGAAFFFASPPS